MLLTHLPHVRPSARPSVPPSVSHLSSHFDPPPSPRVCHMFVLALQLPHPLSDFTPLSCLPFTSVTGLCFLLCHVTVNRPPPFTFFQAGLCCLSFTGFLAFFFSPSLSLPPCLSRAHAHAHTHTSPPIRTLSFWKQMLFVRSYHYWLIKKTSLLLLL